MAGALFGEVQVSLFVAGAIYLVKFKCDFPWQVHYLVKFKCDFPWQVHYLVKFKCHSHAPQQHPIFPHPNFKTWSEHGVSYTFWLANVLRASAACNFSTSQLQNVVRVVVCNFSTSQLQKMVRTWCVLYILTWKCASRHSSMQFFHIPTSINGPNIMCFVHFELWLENGPNMMCFAHFDLKMCFAPQRRAIYPHPNSKKWSEHDVFCTFWLENVLRATAACNFTTSQLQNVVRAWRVLYILTWKCGTWCVLYILTRTCASRHSGVQFFHIPTPRNGPNMMCFVHFALKMCFAPQLRAIYPHPNFKKWSEHDVFCTFWLENVLRATTACNLSTSQLQKKGPDMMFFCTFWLENVLRATPACNFTTSQLQIVARTCQFFSILTRTCASRHSGVQFCHIPTSNSGPNLSVF